MKKRLILAANSFPYDTGEQAFIIPELIRLREYYDITVISHADAAQMQCSYVADELLEGLQILCFPRPVPTLPDKLKTILFYIFSMDGRQEIREIFQSRHHLIQRLYQSLSFYALALADQRALRRSGVLPEGEPFTYYSFWNTYYCYSMIREKKRYPGVRIVSRLHGFDLYHERVPGDRQPFKSRMEADVDSMVFLGEYARSYYRERIQKHGRQKPQMHVCPLGTEAPARFMPQRPKEQDGLSLLSCSELIPLKRVERIIDGLALVENARIQWTHIGGGKEKENLQNYAAERLGNKENIKFFFAGKMEHEKVIQYYEDHQIDCFITTSSTEGMPVSIMEAMSYGIPVIGTCVGGIPEMIRGNGILLSADPSDREVADALNRLSDMSEKEMYVLKSRSHELWKEKFDIRATVKKLLAILQ